MKISKTKVYLVGAGPGRADLITVRGLNILREADVVIYDYLVDKRLLAQAKEGAELICCDAEVLASRRYPAKSNFIRDKLGPSTSSFDRLRTTPERSRTIGKNRYADSFGKHQEKINNLVIKKARQGKKVIRLKNGDPTIFSRCSQELNALVKNKIDFEIVPGVTAASVAASFSGVPLTDRELSPSVVLVTGQEDPKKDKSLIDWGKISSSTTIVLYMAVENLSKIVKNLLEAGKSKDTPVVVVSQAGDINQRQVKGKLKNIAKIVQKENLNPPAIFIIGKVAELEKEFNWLKKNKRILFTGLSPERFFEKGSYFHLPLIKIEPMEDYGQFDNHLRDIKKFDWIVFTSRYGVEYFFKRLKYIDYDTRMLKDIKIAAIGNSTKNKLSDFGILADLVPKRESSKGLLESFSRIDIKDKRIFLPRSDIADKGLTKGLAKLGAKITSGFAYRNVMPTDLPDLDLNFFDEIIFSSPSTVRNFKKRYKKVPQKVEISCIGEVTEKEVKRQGLIANSHKPSTINYKPKCRD